MWPNSHIPTDLITLTEKILNGVFQFLCNESFALQLFVALHTAEDLRKCGLSLIFIFSEIRIYGRVDLRSETKDSQFESDC